MKHRAAQWLHRLADKLDPHRAHVHIFNTAGQQAGQDFADRLQRQSDRLATAEARVSVERERMAAAIRKANQ